MIHPMLGEAWLAMGANRLRTALTMLGMVIGVGAVVIMMAIGQGAQYAVQQTISTMGSNLFIVLSGSFTTAGVRSGSAGAPTLNTCLLAPKRNTVSSIVKGCQDLVRFFALRRIKPHTPLLVRAPVNSFEFQPCGRTPQVDYLLC